MADNKESFQESVMIRRAKRRLFGAVIILIVLFVLSMIFKVFFPQHNVEGLLFSWP